MNELLRIKLPFKQEPNLSGGGKRNLNKTRSTSSQLLESLIINLNVVKAFYKNKDRYVNGILIDIYYNDIIAKSGRIRELLKKTGDCNNSIVGARFTNSEPGMENHIITYYVTESIVDEAIIKLNEAKKLIDEQLNGKATSENFDCTNSTIDYSRYNTSKSKIRDVIIDCSSIEKIDIPNAAEYVEKEQIIVTFFQTEIADFTKLFYDLGVSDYRYTCVGKNTFSVGREMYMVLLEKVPYMISMATSDISEIIMDKNEITDDTHLTIPSPSNEPTIGVIDTLFDTKAYFSEWVDYIECLEDFERASTQEEYYNHGTAVSSIIVDGASLNSDLDDGCGRFKVRHFGVCAGRISQSRLIRKIKSIIDENGDIHVWNLSLGTEEEVSKNYISFDAAAIDEIQYEKNVIFVISGTNDNSRRDGDPYKRIGAPADSLNSIVVNSVRKNGAPVSYARNGKVLSFFNKPDVSYYGGDSDERITVFTNQGIDKQYGTSFAAPWISRKMCYLIDVMGFSREVAKALIIDSAAGWDYKRDTYKYQNIVGYGVVPKRINTILETDNSEIRFVVQGTANTYNTSNYAIPVPKDDDKTNYIARATLCYFPQCNRLQGVDYTQRELSIKFGRTSPKGIIDINDNTQDEENGFTDERTARREYRKWENSKFISNRMKDKNVRALKLYGDGLWGISVTSKERALRAQMNDLNFGVVITLKHTKELNKISDFKHACLLRGYIVNEVKIKNQVELYDKAQEKLTLE